MFVRILLFFSVVNVISGPLEAQTHQGQGTAVGGLAGAVIGGIIGHQNNEVPEGALIGGAVGAIAGNVLGAQRDQQVAVQRYYQHQNWQMQQQLQFQQQQQQLASARGVTTAEVVTMSRSGLSESVIIGHIQTNGVQRPLEVSDVISLHQQGVPETVIQAMQSAATRGASTYVSTPAYPRQVIVHEHYGRPYPPPAYYHSYHHHHRCRYW